jgi:hypothetical protein
VSPCLVVPVCIAPAGPPLRPHVAGACGATGDSADSEVLLTWLQGQEP